MEKKQALFDYLSTTAFHELRKNSYFRAEALLKGWLGTLVECYGIHYQESLAGFLAGELPPSEETISKILDSLKNPEKSRLLALLEHMKHLSFKERK